MAALVEQLAPTASQAHSGIELSVGGQAVAVGTRVQPGAKTLADLHVLHGAVGGHATTGGRTLGSGGGVAVPDAVAQVVDLLAHGILLEVTSVSTFVEV